MFIFEHGFKLAFIKTTHDYIRDEWLRLYGGLSRSKSREKCSKEVSRKEWTGCKVGWDAQRSRWSRKKGCSRRRTRCRYCWVWRLFCLYVVTRREKSYKHANTKHRWNGLDGLMKSGLGGFYGSQMCEVYYARLKILEQGASRCFRSMRSHSYGDDLRVLSHD